MGDSFIIAIDFGTTYSGYAFSITDSIKEIEPHVKYWGDEVGLETVKTPTCILFDENEQFISFGYPAKDSYILKKSKEARQMFFFDCFKMSLYGKKFNMDLKIKAANGKSMNALKVFTEALRFLKEDALKTISNITEKKFIASDFTWVLTVPAIWDHSAKQFMREAATQAGIVSRGTEEKLVIALEPEAASVFCKRLPAEGFIAENQDENKLAQSPGTQYIVVDCGGGTIDITVHEIMEGGALKELLKASGNDLGGQTVDKKFKKFLREIFSDGVWDEYERKFPSEVQKMMYDFTLFKKQDDDAEIDCPYNLGKVAQEKKAMGEYFKGVEGASWDEGSIVISKQKLRDLFAESLNGITERLKEIFSKGLSINYILLVGGYAESQILRRRITEEFVDYCIVLCPYRPQEAIMKGAVQFGRNPAAVASRKSAFTYGVCITEIFDQLKHKEEKKIINEEGEWCDGIFMTLVTADDDVGWDEIKTEILYPTESDQTLANFTFYHTEKKQVTYVDEEGVEEIGSFDVQLPKTTLGRNREIELKVKFGFTEMTATATDKETGSTLTVKLNFMTKS
ncbi:heat shock 70 kDa protein 12A-like [Fundulus heteroclitus]|uniref:heat shock 70 kDa protein 12A-like n=1 Tax=Fundulus heteroclitus TaxID=8078 RepID=UPI00165AAFA2|nr:heat shock 70 kDa protein 12A-like [Fundulus heteroclitus]